MAIDERIQALEDEHKLIRGELKQTLTNVRDFLLDINLPALQQGPEAEVAPEIHEHEEFHEASGEPAAPQNPPVLPYPPMPPQEAEPSMYQQAEPSIPPAPVSQVAPAGQPPTMTIQFEGTPPPAEAVAETEKNRELLQNNDPFQEQEPYETVEKMEEDEEFEQMEPDRELLHDMAPFQEEDKSQALPSTSDKHDQFEVREEVIRYAEQVNLLTNLIRWVSTARREIGNEQLPAFLDVYNIGGHLSSELREVILHLAETIAPKSAGTQADITLPIEANENVAPPAEVKTDTATSMDTKTDAAPSSNPVADADVWSRMILELHGILSRGSASFHPLQISWNGRGENETLQNKSVAEGENSVEEPSNQQSVVTTQEDKAEDKAGNKLSKKGKSKAKRRRSEDRLSSLKENKPARLKLVLSLGDDGEKEFNIGGFSINLAEGD